ncbi:MAG: hypothetical protein CMC13_09025 [Flavobacteriaceae bacterium]|nr:hypothetical protein [Flavobacteriaceae bacterium]|tara:strand:- start:26503 stop:27249 length:747 start_codon:yes stop_codon:yes gene_type:complete
MIKFFRHIRQRFLLENRFSKYLLYAIGEIILVVIGILIALQINNWNNNELNKKEEAMILKNLNFEFNKNKKDLKIIKNNYQRLIGATKQLLDLIGEKNIILQKHNTDSLISESINYLDYRPTENVLSDLISSGNLKLISSDSLRLHLFQWSSFINEKEEAWETLDDFSQNMMMPYLTKNGSLKNIDSYGFLDWKQGSKLQTETNGMFLDIEFENNLDNHAWSLTNYLLALDNLETTINSIITQTSKYR